MTLDACSFSGTPGVSRNMTFARLSEKPASALHCAGDFGADEPAELPRGAGAATADRYAYVSIDTLPKGRFNPPSPGSLRRPSEESCKA